MPRRWTSLRFAMMFLFLVCPPSRAREPEANRPPNFVVILAEGQGWSSMSSPIDDQVPESKSAVNLTANLDQLAKQGMRFANAYASSPRCTPSRASLLTGKSPAQLHMTFVSMGRDNNGGGADAMHKVIEPHCLFELPQTETTIAELLKRQGYATAHFGKWHLGRVSPAAHGFDESDGATGNEGLASHPEETGRMTDRGADFMARQSIAGKPFYLQISYYPARGTQDVMAATIAAVRQRLAGKTIGRGGDTDRRMVEAAANQDMDESIGRLLRKVDELGLAPNTYVIFTSDHGSQGRNANAPLSFGKGTLWEGGIRVPLVIRGPEIVPGSVSHTRVIGTDLFPTLAGLAREKSPLPTGLEGGSLLALLKHAGTGEVKRPREELVLHFPHYDMDDRGPSSALLLGDFKLIRLYVDGSLHLYDLRNDIREQHDLAGEMPAKLKELDEKLTAYLHDVGAQLPTPNPNYDSSRARELLRPGRRD